MNDDLEHELMSRAAYDLAESRRLDRAERRLDYSQRVKDDIRRSAANTAFSSFKLLILGAVLLAGSVAYEKLIGTEKRQHEQQEFLASLEDRRERFDARKAADAEKEHQAFLASMAATPLTTRLANPDLTLANTELSLKPGSSVDVKGAVPITVPPDAALPLRLTLPSGGPKPSKPDFMPVTRPATSQRLF